MDASHPARVSSATGAIAPDAEPAVTIRPLTFLPEFQACVALQQRVWGDGFSEAVAVSLLQAASYIGGLVIGAYSREETLVGFVFGLTGVKDGRTVHWSHLLGVLDSARNLGVGRMLKEYQRAELARRGIPEMLWTFDPLIAKNAHLNLNLLGARVVGYTPNMYGMTETPLHHSLPTDRFVVSCATSDIGDRRSAIVLAAADAPVMTLEPRPKDLRAEMRDVSERTLRLELPSEFQHLVGQSPARAAEWHAAVRRHFLWALGNGYVVAGLHRDAVTSRCFYVLTTEPLDA